MNSVPKPKTEHYTVADYMSWDDGERWELIDGVAYNMSPAPTVRHHEIGANVYAILRNRLKGKPCKPFIAAVDVVLSDRDVVQPDAFVVCDRSKITPQNIQGAPDFVVEILSPSTSRKDLREKKALYQRAGVTEYLVLDPLEMYALLYRLDGQGQYGVGEVYGPDESLILQVLGEEAVDLQEIFALDEE
ncbi:MAG: Uma2 family endonuclease [Candidatus Methylumidiphilus sp.]